MGFRRDIHMIFCKLILCQTSFAKAEHTQCVKKNEPIFICDFVFATKARLDLHSFVFSIYSVTSVLLHYAIVSSF